MKMHNTFRQHLQRFAFMFLVVGSWSCNHLPSLQQRHIAAARCEQLFSNKVVAVESTAQGLNAADAQKLLEQNRWQEAAWLLRQVKEVEMSVTLEEQMADNLKNAPLKSFELMDTGDSVSEVYLVTLANGQKAVFKPYAEHWKSKHPIHAAIANPLSEVMAYEFGKTLQTTLVPVTVMREINGMKGSLQAFVKMTTLLYSYSEMQNPELYRLAHRIVHEPMEEQKKVIQLFDYLIFNTDRHPGNLRLSWVIYPKVDPRSQVGEGSGFVAYDNGAAFQNQILAKGNYKPSRPVLDKKNLGIYKEFFKALKEILTDEKITEIMTGKFDEVTIQQTINRRHELLRLYFE